MEKLKITAETFILQILQTTNDNKDRLHTEDIKEILNAKGLKFKSCCLQGKKRSFIYVRYMG